MSRYRNPQDITELVIHCAATPNGRHHTAVDIDRWHGPDREAMGRKPFVRDLSIAPHHAPRLRHIGYHFVVQTSGAVEVGRSLRETGAHARGHNGISIGTCLIGLDQFTPAQWLALRKHVEAFQRDYHGKLRVLGHNEVAPKICPGFDVQAWLAGGMAPLAEHIFEDQLSEVSR